ncbi:uncharacterized protein LOC130649504 [Hydractinia symbiolongicarpus]|uniref:uncharacterized protein LOC130649504 n=1 Tax=Hydractinia symbiolongicarpus TaxID=13093 RepID=UPI0025514949|nr:uncharacterized protein LOC130649504 [Hydractinia symbiolongicarpus]
MSLLLKSPGCKQIMADVAARTSTKKGATGSYKKSDGKTEIEFLFLATSNHNDVYQNCKASLKNENVHSITIHGLESSIPMAMKVALMIKKEVSSIEIQVLTSSVDLINSLQIVGRLIEPSGLKQSCAAVHLVLKKTKPTKTAQEN